MYRIVTGDTDRRALRVLLGGILGLIVAMGIGRFSFTPILPLMQRDLGINHSLAGNLAALNYIGYLLGAVLCSTTPRLLNSSIFNVGALLTSILSTFLMAWTTSPALWGLLRFTGGLASAFLFVLIAIEVSEALIRSNHSRWGTALYGGVGLGIAISGVAVPLLDRLGNWQTTWFGMGVLAVLLSTAGVLLAGKRKSALDLPEATPVQAGHGNLKNITRLAIAYFLEGFGYIISGTFLVTIIVNTPGLTGFAPLSWVAVGLAAAPSTIIWQQVANRFSVRQALIAAFTMQAFGIFLSSIASNVFTAILSAIIFGGTFMGIVALVMVEGGRRSGKDGRRAAAVLTACFGGGQVLGPPLAGFLADWQGGFTLSLIIAGLVVSAGAVLVATDKGFQVRPVK